MQALIIQEGLQYFWMEEIVLEHFRKWQMFVIFLFDWFGGWFFFVVGFFNRKKKNILTPKISLARSFRAEDCFDKWISVMDNTQHFIWKPQNKSLALKHKNIIAHIDFMRTNSSSVGTAKKFLRPLNLPLADLRFVLCDTTVLQIFIF